MWNPFRIYRTIREQNATIRHLLDDNAWLQGELSVAHRRNRQIGDQLLTADAKIARMTGGLRQNRKVGA